MYQLLREFLEEDQANLVICMLASIPLSYLLSILRPKYLSLALSITVTLAFQSFLFPTEKHFLWIQHQVVYLLICFVPRKIVGHVVFAESFLVLSYIQIRRMYLSYGINGVDITGIFMMQTFVWVGLGYNYQNGGFSKESLTKEAAGRAVIERPDYLTYLGYTHFLPACLIGPVYEYSDYADYLHRRGDYAQIPNNLKAIGWQILVFIATLAIYIGMMPYQIDYVISKEFDDFNLLYKFLYICVSIFHTEFKYISAWSLGMISMKASGFTYNPKHNQKDKDGNIVSYNFDRVKASDLSTFYIKPSVKEKAEGWNVSVQSALRKYIYEQVYDPKGTYSSDRQRAKAMNKARLITLMTSAVWHGFYPGYFVSFFHWALYLTVSTEFYKFRIKSEFMKSIWEKYHIAILQNILSTFVLLYFGAAMHLMIWERVQVYLLTTYALPYLVLYISFFLIVKMRILQPRKGMKEAVKVE